MLRLNERYSRTYIVYMVRLKLQPDENCNYRTQK